MKDYVIFILILLVPLFRPRVFRVVFLYILIYRGYYAIPHDHFKMNILEKKNYIRNGKEFNQNQHF